MSVSKFLKEKDINMSLSDEIFFINDEEEDTDEHRLFMFTGDYNYDQDQIVDLEIELITHDQFIDLNKKFFENISYKKMEKLKSIWPV